MISFVCGVRAMLFNVTLISRFWNKANRKRPGVPRRGNFHQIIVDLILFIDIVPDQLNAEMFGIIEDSYVIFQYLWRWWGRGCHILCAK